MGVKGLNNDPYSTLQRLWIRPYAEEVGRNFSAWTTLQQETFAAFCLSELCRSDTLLSGKKSQKTHIFIGALSQSFSIFLNTKIYYICDAGNLKVIAQIY